MRWLRTLAKLFAAVENNTFTLGEGYNFEKTTSQNYEVDNREFVGDYVDIRATRDYSYHSNYSPARQRWQDFAIKCCLGKTEAHARPWIIYTCGPMGVGKGHVLSWLSKRGLFPVEYIVHIDPDFFKRIMPEWSKYVSVNKEFAGTACHKESGFLQEIAMEVSMRERQHVWVDGSLSDGEWFKKEFEDIRLRFPHYRIAIFYIAASEATIRSRIAKRTAETGRSVPESQVLRSLQCPETSLVTLAPLTDIVARIWNENRIELKSVEDYSGNWDRGLGRLFTNIEIEELKFPHSLGTLYLEKTSFLGAAFVSILDRSRVDRHLVKTDKWCQEEEGEMKGKKDKSVLMEGYLDKDGKFRLGLKRRYFVLQPGSISYYRSHKKDEVLKGEFSLYGTFELVPNMEITESTPKRRSSLQAIAGVLKKDSLDKETGFYIRGFHTDGTIYSLSLRAPSPVVKGEWIAAISAELARVKATQVIGSSASLAGMGSLGTAEPEMGPKDTTTLEISKKALVASPNLRVLSTRLNPIYLEASPVCEWTSREKDTTSITGAPCSTTHFRFLYPSAQVQASMHKNLVTGVEDPDILLLLFGGFAYLDEHDNIVGM
jgi:hypothetical protein